MRHPKASAKLLDVEISRLKKERFNMNQFMCALVRTYDVLLAVRQAGKAATSFLGQREDVHQRIVQSVRRILAGLSCVIIDDIDGESGES